MKATKKILSLVLVLAVVLAFGATAFAQTITYTGTDATTDGKITINNATVGEDYAIYKLFDAVPVNGAITYKLPQGKTLGTDPTVDPAAAWFELDSAGNVVTKKDTGGNVVLTPDVMRTDAFKNWAVGFGTRVASTPTAVNPGDPSGATSSPVVFDKVPYGYYYVTSSVGALVSVDTAAPTVVIEDKNSPPSWDNDDMGKVLKVLTCTNTDPTHVHDDSCYKKVEANAEFLDEEMIFDIGIDAKNYDGADKIFRYVIADQMDPGMTFTSQPVVSVPGVNSLLASAYAIDWWKIESGNNKVSVPAANWTTANGFTITIPWTNNNAVTGDFLYTSGEIHVTYGAKLDSAKVNDINLVDANKNKAGFDWYKGSENPNTPKDPLGPNPTVPAEETNTYSTSLNIKKIDGNGNALQGAEFKLEGASLEKAIVTSDVFTQDNTPNAKYWKLKGTPATYTQDDPTKLHADAIANPGNYDTSIEDPTDPKYAYEYDRTKYDSVSIKYAKTTTRTLKDTTAATPVEIEGPVNAAGELTFGGLGEGTYTLTETKAPDGFNAIAPKTIVVTFNEISQQFEVTVDGVAVPYGKTIELDVVNNAGTELPSTGGIGTTIFYILGSCLLLGAAVLLITRRRMKNEG